MKKKIRFNKEMTGRLLGVALYFIAYLITVSLLRIELSDHFLPGFLTPPGGCVFRSLTGLYCPACGGTRAVRHFFAGEPLQSFLKHPAVLYTAFLCWIWSLSFLAEKLSKGKLRRYRIRAWQFYVLIGLFFLHFIVANVLLLVFGVDMIGA